MNNNNETISLMIGGCDFENYWGEKLVVVDIIHYMSNIFDVDQNNNDIVRLFDVNDKTKIFNTMIFIYGLGSVDLLDYWKVKIITESGKVYSSRSGLRCSIKNEDRGNVILGVNGNAKRMYISMTDSGSCSKPLWEIQ